VNVSLQIFANVYSGTLSIIVVPGFTRSLPWVVNWKKDKLGK